MKRKRIVSFVSSCTRSKKPKLCTAELPKRKIEWISATHVKNFIMNDHLVDWLKRHKKQTSFGNNLFGSFIMNKGIEFEKTVVKHINDVKTNVVTVSERITPESLKKTIELMKSGTPVIHSAPVRNRFNRTQGVIDLLVRSDYLHLIIDDCPLTEEEISIPAPKLGTNYHYVVIDVKYSTIPLRSDGVHILNSGFYPFYKAQTLIYTECIGKIQGYTSPYSFILGRRWNYKFQENGVVTKCKNMSSLNKLGVINYSSVDIDYKKKTKDAIRWVRDVKRNGHKWSVSPPSKKELYPNMCRDSGKWQKHKQQIAEEIGEISSVWNCGVKHREIGLQNGISSWKDPDCTSKNIGIKGKRAPIIDRILSINRQSRDKIRPKKIKNNILDWRNKKGKIEMFVDFETMMDIFSPMSEYPKQKSTDFIFMIGVYWKNKKKWEYKNFICNDSSFEEEFRIMEEFAEFLKSKGNPRLWYWFADNMLWNRAVDRQYNLLSEEDEDNINEWYNLDWVDLYKVFKQTPIVIKDCFKYGLKPVAKAMEKYKLITTKIDSECSSGLEAVVNAWKCYENEDDPANCSVMNDIAEYNKFDCKVLQDILFYLRKKH